MPDDQDAKQLVPTVTVGEAPRTLLPTIVEQDKKEETILLIPVRNMVLFPGVVLPVVVSRPRSVESIQEAVRTQASVGLILQRDEKVEDPKLGDLFSIGTVAEIVRYLTAPDGRHHAICQGQQRFRLLELIPGVRGLSARIQHIAESMSADDATQARFLALKEQAREVLALAPNAPEDLSTAVAGITSPSLLADMVATFLDIPLLEKQEILETLDVGARMEKVAGRLAHLSEVLQLSQKIRTETQSSLSKAQREYYLREQLKQIQKELEGDEGERNELAGLKETLAAAGMPAEIKKEIDKEVRRLERMNEAAAEYAMLRTYLDVIAELPWSKATKDVIDISRARKVLEQDHYGLERVKRLILEYLAVRKLKPDGRRPNLCLVGPPGVGKTSLGQSIAKAMGRKFVRISLGGVHDEAEIRGHRRTYIGALPGVIISSLRKAQSSNPVFMLDEMDKLGSGIQGDPSSALLEVLDPEQNKTFRDNYLGVPFDLSQVLFIGTANVLDQIPLPLRDRFEIINLPGYTRQEKLEIAKRYLLPRQLEQAGLSDKTLKLEDKALARILIGYTRESGVRGLERQIASIVRWVAARIAEKKVKRMTVRVPDVERILGAARFENETRSRTSVPGVATGLAWTAVGGEILFVEATSMPGHGQLILTGQLGDVMRESAQAALSLVKSRPKLLKLDPKYFETHDIHLHLPAGAIPKDGPSAGITMYTALVSLLSARNVLSDTAMTGEISLRGLVLPVGGIKEKVLGAHAAGIRRVLLPERNKPDIDEVPASVRKEMEFVLLNRVDDAMRYALEPIPGVRKTVRPKKSTKPIRASKPKEAPLRRRKPSKLAKRGALQIRSR